MTSVDSTRIYGTLNLMILGALADGELHGLGVQRRIHAATEGRVKVEVGALYPALHRLERDGLLRASWGHSESGRRARFYTLTPGGRRRLEREASAWTEHVRALARLLGASAPAKARP